MPLKPRLVFTLFLTFSVPAGAQTAAINTVPSREVGHPVMPKPDPFAISTANPNLIEGRELFGPTGVALDTRATPPIIYVADTNNNRVLGWKNATSFANGKAADLVIGQKDGYSTSPNGPGLSSFTLGFNSPQGVAVLNGDLYVSDTGNNRVL